MAVSCPSTCALHAGALQTSRDAVSLHAQFDTSEFGRTVAAEVQLQTQHRVCSHGAIPSLAAIMVTSVLLTRRGWRGCGCSSPA